MAPWQIEMDTNRNVELNRDGDYHSGYASAINRFANEDWEDEDDTARGTDATTVAEGQQ